VQTRPGLPEFSRSECLDLLRNAALGRVGVSVDALPAIFPVLLTVVDDVMVLRSAPGTEAAVAGGGAIVAIEVDAVDETTGAGWSVLVRGVARELTAGPRLEAARARLGPTWLDGARDHLVEVSTDLVTGRPLG
jgi:nitroimidazol reductase NimA-like FMN-containing flavoprotein (pyridoxamine 5'-phosphate oxidase superfamily)